MSRPGLGFFSRPGARVISLGFVLLLVVLAVRAVADDTPTATPSHTSPTVAPSPTPPPGPLVYNARSGGGFIPVRSQTPISAESCVVVDTAGLGWLVPCQLAPTGYGY
jgi:hypothetical protein